jgi:hypothetical protein
MDYMENELTSTRRECEKLFTAAIASQILGWGHRGEWETHTRSHSELCAITQSALLHRKSELINIDNKNPDAVWFVDDFAVMISQAHILASFLCGFYDPRSYKDDIDIPALERHLGIPKKPLVLMVAEAITGGEPYPSYTPDATSLSVIKRRHWNRFARNKSLHILLVSNVEQARQLVTFLSSELQENHLRGGLYFLGFHNWDQLRTAILNMKSSDIS